MCVYIYVHAVVSLTTWPLQTLFSAHLIVHEYERNHEYDNYNKLGILYVCNNTYLTTCSYILLVKQKHLLHFFYFLLVSKENVYYIVYDLSSCH